jgi:hypothetical protein
MIRKSQKNRFDEAVVVQTGRIDRNRVVTTTAQAAGILLHEWPKTDSDARVRAMLACLAVIKGVEAPRHARDAFIAAAKDARVFLYEHR